MNPHLLVSPDLTLLQAMDALTRGEERIVFVVDPDGVLLGTLTDGDVRRFILAGNDLSGSIRNAFNRHPVVVREGTLSMEETMRLFQAHAVNVIPVIDERGRVAGRLSAHEAFGRAAARQRGEIRGTPVVIMAGGVGTRLQPFTHVLPKALMPIHGKPIIDHIIDRFRAAGVTAFVVTLHHKARILRAYLEDGHGDDVTFVEEDTPLGTAGALGLLAGRFDQPVVVTNCDVLVATNYRELVDFHTASSCGMTLVASVRNFRLPYGACALGPDGTLDGIAEKPEMTRLVNTGMYVINPGLFDVVPRGRAYDMTTLMDDLMCSGGDVAVFPVSSQAWVDIGEWQEYRRATRLMEPATLREEEPA